MRWPATIALWSGLAACAAHGPSPSGQGGNEGGSAADAGSSGGAAQDSGAPSNDSGVGDASADAGVGGPLAFVDVADDLGLPPLGSQCLAFEDLDGDSKPDILMVQQSQTGAEALNVYLNRNGGFFAPVTSSLALYAGQNVHCAVGDLDNDGLPDVAVSVEFQRTVYLLKNAGGGVLEQTGTLTLPTAPRAGGGAPLAFADFDGDGWLDLLAAIYEAPPTPGQMTCGQTTDGYACTVSGTRCGPPPVIYPNDGTGNLGAFVSVVDPSTCSPADVNAIALTDYDGDGRPDFFVANDWGVDALYVQGATPMQFSDVSAGLGLKGYNHAMGVAFADFDRDGNPDLFVSDLGSSQFYLGSPGGTLASHGTDWGVATATTFTSEWAALAEDFDSDGFMDVWVANSAEVHSYADMAVVGGGTLSQELPPTEISDFAFQNLGGHGFQLILAPQTLQASPIVIEGATATADYDADGRPDVVELVGSPTRVQLMHNVGPVSHWLDVRLHGMASNRDGLGARVTVKEAGLPDATRIMTRSRGSIGESAAVLHYGLGLNPGALSIEVAWPSGTKQSVPAPATDQTITVVEAGP